MASTEDGDDLSAGRTNFAQSGTELRCDEAQPHDGSDFILQVRALTSARVGAIRAIAASFGVSGQAAGGEGGGTGVIGSGRNGVEGQGDLNGTGVTGTGGQNGVLGKGRVGVFGQGSIIGVQGGPIPGNTVAIGVSGSGTTGVAGGGVTGVDGVGTNAEHGFLVRLRHKFQKPSNDAAFESLRDWLFLPGIAAFAGVAWFVTQSY